MVEDIRRMIDSIKNVNYLINENINPKLKKDIDFVYQQYPELNKIGSKEEYGNYINTIFTNSKIRGIFYHVSPNKFLQFKDPSNSGLTHIWFSEKPLSNYGFGDNIYCVVLDVKNPLSEYDSNYGQEIRNYESPINPDWVNNYNKTGEQPKFKYDGTIRASRVDGGKSITVRNPKQIHILGSKEDIESFKKFLVG